MTTALRRLAACAALIACAAPVFGASLAVQVLDAKGQPLPDAGVFLESVGAPAPPLRVRRVEIEQKDRQFNPFVTVVQTGTAVNFPNNDSVRHHVYSFSKPKVFELRLYSGTPASPIVFDKPGTVVLGCNIHDRMVAYIRVVDTPWFGKTGKDGKVKLEGIPEGQYRLKAWTPELLTQDVAAEQTIAVKGDVEAMLKVEPR